MKERIGAVVLIGIVMVSLLFFYLPPPRRRNAFLTISSDSDFLSQGWNGTGTVDDPFVIEGLEIVSDAICIMVSDTSAHFVIRNCSLESTGAHRFYAVYFSGVTNGRIENCTLLTKPWWSDDVRANWVHGIGVLVEDSIACEIERNAIHNNGDGVVISSSPSCSVIGNTIYNNIRGIEIIGSDDCAIESNTLYSNTEGIVVFGSNRCEVKGHLFPEGPEGLTIAYSENCVISQNRFEGCGIRIGDTHTSTQWSHTFLGNTVNDKPIGYLWGISDSEVNGSEYGQVILANCENASLIDCRSNNTTVAIQVGYSERCKVEASSIQNNTVAVLLSYSTSCKINSNVISGNEQGINLHWSNNTEVSGNSVSWNKEGITTHMSGDLLVVDNSMVKNTFTAFLSGADHSVIRGNVILDSEDIGFVLGHSESCLFENNTILLGAIGVEIVDSTSCIVRENSVYNCSLLGIRIDSASSNCKVFYNIIGWNDDNAKDDGTSNMWDDDVSQGNFWSDYSGDGWYEISGDAGSVDRFPSSL